MKQYFKLCAISLLLISNTIHTYDEQAKKASLQIIASLSQDIAEIVINHRHAKDPEIAKQRCISLVTHMAEVIATIVVTIQERKATRAIDLTDQTDYQLAVEAITTELLKKINNCEQII